MVCCSHLPSPPPPPNPTTRHTASVTTPAGTLSTAGTSLVDITGSNLGVNASVVSITCTGGSNGLARRTYSLPTGTCTIVTAGTRIRCASAPGVGTNYTFVVTVDGVPSAPSVDALSYAAPSVGSVYGPGAALVSTEGDGNTTIFLSGSGFGPVDGNTTLVVWAVPGADDSLAFPGVNCTVYEAHVTIACTMGDVMGASLTWRVAVEGQNNTLPTSTVAPPVVTGATLDAGTAVAATSGGTTLVVEGCNFCARTDRVKVTITMPGGDADATGCAYTLAHRVLRCLLPPGVGPITRVAVSVLGQVGHLDITGMTYAPPTVSFVAPATWPTDVTSMTVTVTGSGFGSPAMANLVSASVSAQGSLCAAVTLNASSLSVLSDSELSFVLRTPAPHVVTRWALSVSVAGQALAATATVATQPPTAPVVGVARPRNATHQFLSLTGTNYGPMVSPCSNDATVSVNGQPCGGLAMTQVSDAC
jgi:hypothetical protein